MTGIAFNLILIRAAQRRVEEASCAHEAAVSAIRFNPSTTKTAASAFVGVDAMRTIEIRPADAAESPDSGSLV